MALIKPPNQLVRLLETAVSSSQTVFTFSGSIPTGEENMLVLVDGTGIDGDFSITAGNQITLDSGVPIGTEVEAIFGSLVSIVASASGADGAIQFATGGLLDSEASNISWNKAGNELDITGNINLTGTLDIIGTADIFGTTDINGTLKIDGNNKIEVGAGGSHDFEIFKDGSSHLQIQSVGGAGPEDINLTTGRYITLTSSSGGLRVIDATNTIMEANNSSVTINETLNQNGKLNITAPSVQANINLNSVTPTSPSAGDFWRDGDDLFFRDSTTTQQVQFV